MATVAIQRLFHSMRTGLDTMEIRAAGQRYECLICENQFLSPVKLTLHYVTCHELTYCPTSKRLFANDDYLKAATVPAKCTECSFEGNSAEELECHHFEAHSLRKCNFCSNWMRTEEFRPHLNDVHHARELPTEIFTTSQAMVNCRLCAGQFKSEKFFNHFLFYHKFSAFDLHRFVGNSEVFQVISKSLEVNDPHALDLQTIHCEFCHRKYSVHAPKAVHRIVCGNLAYCAVCRCFGREENHSCAKSDERAGYCKFCHDQTTIDDDHMAQQHRLTAVFVNDEPIFLRVLDDRVRCTSCDKELILVDSVVEHFVVEHSMEPMAFVDVLRRAINSRSETIQEMKSEAQAKVEVEVKVEIEVEVPNEIKTESRAKANSEIKVEIKVPNEPLSDIENEESDSFSEESDNACADASFTKVVRESQNAVTDFDPKLVKCIFSSGEDDPEGATKNRSKSQLLRVYSCAYCGRGNPSKYQLVCHMTQRHGFLAKLCEYRCHLCKRVFAKARSLRVHNEKVHENQRRDAKCPFCDFNCGGRMEMRKHISEHVESNYHPCDSKELGFGCHYCHMSFWTMEILHEHQLNRHSELLGENFMLCLICGATFLNKTALRRHTAFKHPEEKQIEGLVFQCDVCKMAYTNLAGMRRHMGKVHSTHTSLFCPIENCRQILAKADDLHDHSEKLHKSADFFCNGCTKRFASAEGIEKHFEKKRKTN